METKEVNNDWGILLQVIILQRYCAEYFQDFVSINPSSLAQTNKMCRFYNILCDYT